jgi:hypothetical protein
MTGPWQNYAAQPAKAAGPWQNYGSASQDSAKQQNTTPEDNRPTSFGLGFEEGAANVFDRATQGLKWFANQVKVPFSAADPRQNVGMGDVIERAGTSLGLPSTEQAVTQHQEYLSEQEKTQKPSGWGRFAGEVASTLPLGGIENPWVAGGAVGGLVGHGQTPGGITADVLGGAAGGKLFHAGTGYVLRKSSPYLRSAANRASNYVSRLMEGAGKSVEDLSAYGAKTFGKPVTGAEAIGRTGKTALTALGRREGETPEALEGVVAQRRAERASRMLDDITETTGISPAAAIGELDSIVSQGRKEAAPLYQMAFEATPNTSSYLERLAKDPIVRKGMQHGVRIEQLAALKENRPFDPNAYAVVNFNEAGDPIIGPVPTWRTWDAAKTGIDHVLETNYRNKLTGRLDLDAMGREIDGVRRSMLNEVDSLNPAYAAARARAGDYLSAREAFQDGTRTLFDSKVTEKQFVDRLGRMSKSDIEALKGGVANHLFNLAQTGRLKPSLLNTPRIKSKMIMVLGRENTEKLIDRYTVEHEMLTAENRMQPGMGSVTSEVMGAFDEQDASAKIASELGHAAVYAGAGMPHAAAFRLANVLRSLPAFARTGGMPVEVRNEVGKMLLMTPDELADVLRERPQILKDLSKSIGSVQSVTTPIAVTAGAQIGQ